MDMIVLKKMNLNVFSVAMLTIFLNIKIKFWTLLRR